MKKTFCEHVDMARKFSTETPVRVESDQSTGLAMGLEMMRRRKMQESAPESNAPQVKTVVQPPAIY